MFPKKNSLFIVLVFLAAISLPFIFSNKHGGEISIVENRHLAIFPKIFTSEMKLAPGIRNGIESWIKDNCGFRAQLKKVQIAIDYNVFHVSSSDLVRLGREGWFYYTGGNNLEIAMGTYPLTSEMLEKIKENQVDIQQALKKKGIEYVLVLAPSKVSIYPEYLIGGNFQIRETAIDIVTEYLQKNTTIHVINTKNDLLNAKLTGDVYFKTDSHWNEAGAYVAYSSIINALNQWGIIHSTPIEINTEPSFHLGEATYLLGDLKLLPPEPFDSTLINSPSAVKNESSDDFLKIKEIIQKDDNTIKYFSYINQDAENESALIYGDSFFGSWKMTDLFAENFRNLDFIWSDILKDDVIERVKPDLVIMERTERYIFALANDPDPDLIYEPLKDPKAEILSENTPTEFEVGKKYDLEVTVKNMGDELWNEARAIRLSINVDGKDVGLRAYLPTDHKIEPGDSYTFVIHDFPSPPPETSYLEYQMVEEGIRYFGEKQRVDIIVK